MKKKTRMLVHIALLIAIEIILERFASISTPVVRIGFGFVPVAVCGMLYGPVWGAVAGGLSDLLGAVAFPFVGAYFPGFTVSATLSGLVFGLFLFRREGWQSAAGAVAVNCFGISLFLTTLWLHIMYGSPYFALLVPRIVQVLIMAPIQFLLITALRRPVGLYARRFTAPGGPPQ